MDGEFRSNVSRGHPAAGLDALHEVHLAEHPVALVGDGPQQQPGDRAGLDRENAAP